MKAQISEYKANIAELTSKVAWLMEQFRLARHRRFGASSEKSDYEQMNFFNEPEAASDILVPEPELVEVEKHFRKRKNMVNDKLPKDLPVSCHQRLLRVSGGCRAYSGAKVCNGHSSLSSGAGMEPLWN